MEFTIKTVYSYETLLNFNSFYARSRKGFWGIVIALDILYSAFISVIFGAFGFDEDLFFAWLFLMLITALYLVIYFVLPRFKLKKSPLLDAVCIVTFTDEKIIIDAETAHSTESVEIKYSGIVKVMEDDEYFYLFRTKNNANIIDKNGFITGNAEAFKDFLRGKIEPKNFKCK